MWHWQNKLGLHSISRSNVASAFFVFHQLHYQWQTLLLIVFMQQSIYSPNFFNLLRLLWWFPFFQTLYWIIGFINPWHLNCYKLWKIVHHRTTKIRGNRTLQGVQKNFHSPWPLNSPWLYRFPITFRFSVSQTFPASLGLFFSKHEKHNSISVKAVKSYKKCKCCIRAHNTPRYVFTLPHQFHLFDFPVVRHPVSSSL